MVAAIGRTDHLGPFLRIEVGVVGIGLDLWHIRSGQLPPLQSLEVETLHGQETEGRRRKCLIAGLGRALRTSTWQAHVEPAMRLHVLRSAFKAPHPASRVDA